nr:Conjugative transfer protein TrbJ [Salmonella enterica subsp. enterica serovar Rissen]
MALPAQAGIPVIDGTNVVQTTISAVNNVQAVAKQIQQYQTQLQQYENMLKNTVAPAAYIWDQANSTINKLLQAQDTLNYYKNQAGSLDSYLKRYQDVNYYRSSPCFNSNVECTADEISALRKAEQNSSEARKRPTTLCLRLSTNSRKHCKAMLITWQICRLRQPARKGKWKLFRQLTSLPVLKRTSCCKSARSW